MAEKGNTQITEIANQLGLSPGTVSVVLNGRGDKLRISKATQKKVKDAAKELGYQPNIYARRLRNSGDEVTSRVIAVFWNPGYADEIMGSFFRGLQHTSNEKEYHAEFYVHMFEYGQLSECGQLITPNRFSGAIICGISDTDAKYLDSHSFEIPVVCVFRKENKFHSVHVNDYDIGVNTALLFAKRGHRVVGLIGSIQNGPSSILRKMGYINKCRELGLLLEDGCLREEEGRDFVSGYEAMRGLVSLKERPTAVFVNVPEQAIGAVTACKNAGLTFQKDIEILSVGGIKIFEYFYPSISTVCTPVEEFAEKSMNLLMMAIQNDIEQPTAMVLEPHYIFGDTCGGF